MIPGSGQKEQIIAAIAAGQLDIDVFTRANTSDIAIEFELRSFTVLSEHYEVRHFISS
jgi:hypothetical protein